MNFLSIGTGAGIGLETAERFANGGFRVAVAARNAEKTQELADQIKANGHQAEAFRVDASDLGSVESLVSSVEKGFGGIDVLHYNAASMRHATILDQPASTFLSDLAVNLGGALVAVHAVAKLMERRGAGTILLTGGGYALKPNPEYLSLSVGKAGLRAIAYGLFDTFRAKGIHVAMVTVKATITPGSNDAQSIAELFWKLHTQPASLWTVEEEYKA